MDSQEKHELFRQRWVKYQKFGIVRYALFLALLYSLTVFSISVLFDFSKAYISLSEIFSLVNNTLIIKTIVFFFFGIIFGKYHYKKSEKKYNNSIE